MDFNLLNQAAANIQDQLFQAIRSGTYNGKKYSDGQKAKEALIRSQSLIMNVHEAVKKSLCHELLKKSQEWKVYPPINETSPELKIYGLLKPKNQDVVFLSQPKKASVIEKGPNAGEKDPVGFEPTESSIIIGVRSQLSSVDKNFDTLMERAFAETLNLRLRAPQLCIGEVYLLPLEELDDGAMRRNSVEFKLRKVNVGKFIKIFNALRIGI